MNFTRDPILETVITPKDGYKLSLRNSKCKDGEEFFVDSLEVISFGNSYFYRFLDKPRSFLVPMNDYDVIEVREAKVSLKTGGSVDQGIKIAGGRASSIKASKQEEEPVVTEEGSSAEEQKSEKSRDNGRRGRKNRSKSETKSESVSDAASVSEKQSERPALIPPPLTLISETLQYKQKDITPEDVLQDEIGEPAEESDFDPNADPLS